MDDGREPFSGGLCIREEKTLGDLRQCITDGFRFISKRYGEVAFELGDQVRDDGALKGGEIREGEQLADILRISAPYPTLNGVSYFILAMKGFVRPS